MIKEILAWSFVIKRQFTGFYRHFDAQSNLILINLPSSSDVLYQQNFSQCMYVCDYLHVYGGNSCSVRIKVLDYGLEVSEFELQSFSDDHF